MRSPRKLSLEPLENRAVPATFFWIGDLNSNANDFENYDMPTGAEATRMPTIGDRIIIGPNQQRTMYIHGNNTIDCDSIAVQGLVALSVLETNRQAGDPSRGHLFVAGILNIQGWNVPAAGPHSSISGGNVEVHTAPPMEPGRVNLIGGKLTYSGGEIDTILNNTGQIYVYGGGVLELAAGEGKIGASLFIGRPYEGDLSSGWLKLTGNMTFYRDANVGIAPGGIADLLVGGLKLYNFGGWGGNTGTGFYQNMGHTQVRGVVNSDMYVENTIGGRFVIATGQKFDTAGSKFFAPGYPDVSFLNNGGTVVLQHNATLRLAQQYLQDSGFFVCDEAGTEDARFAVNGNMDIAGGKVVMGLSGNEIKFGTLTVLGTLRFRDFSTLWIDVKGDENKCDVVSATSIQLDEGCSLEITTVGVPAGATQREFLQGSVSGHWSDPPSQYGDFTMWSLITGDPKKIKWPPDPPDPPGGGG